LLIDVSLRWSAKCQTAGVKLNSTKRNRWRLDRTAGEGGENRHRWRQKLEGFCENPSKLEDRQMAPAVERRNTRQTIPKKFRVEKSSNSVILGRTDTGCSRVGPYVTEADFEAAFLVQ